MAELDEIVQKVLLDGDLEVINKFSEIGEKGAEAFEQLSEAAEKGAGGLTVIATGAALAATSIVGLAGALTSFVNVNTEAIQQTNFLGEAFGATTEQINGIEAAFAQAGVSTKQFEQFAQRLTVTIAREWPTIAENIRTASIQQEEAQDRVVAATLRVQDAQNNLQTVGERSQSAITNAAIAQAEAFVKLQFAAQEASAQIVNDLNNVTSANLGVEAAEQRLRQAEGVPVSAAEKQALEIKQAQLALDKARQAEADALRKKQEDAAEAEAKQAKLEQEAADAELKHQTAVNEAMTARQKAELAVSEATTARAEAEERAQQVALKNIPAISSALGQLVQGNKEVANSFDFSQVSVRNMVNSIIALAAEGNKLPPSGLKVMETLMDVLHNDTTNVIDAQTRLAIVQQLSQRGFSATSGAAFELLAALERGKDGFKQYEEQMKGFSFTSDKAKEDVKEFRDAITLLTNAIDNVNREFAASAAPFFTEMLKAVTESLRSSDGLLHQFVDGIAALGVAFGAIVTAGRQVVDVIAHMFNATPAAVMKTVIEGLIVLVATFASAWLAVPATIAAVILVLGYVREHMNVIIKAIEDAPAKFGAIVAIITAIVGVLAPIPLAIGAIIAAIVLVYENWDRVKQAIEDNAAVQAIVGFFKSIYDWASKIADKIASWFSHGTPKAPSDSGGTQSGSESGAELHAATGGHVRGPGTSTSDSIPARLSDGEFVIRSAAVQKFGVGFMHAINSMMMPAFASGGLVGTPARMSSGNVQASRALNLTIGEKTFSGLRGPASTINDLQNYATSRQVSATGRQPSWVK